MADIEESVESGEGEESSASEEPTPLSDVFSGRSAPASKEASEKEKPAEDDEKEEGDQKFRADESSSDDDEESDEKSDEKDEKSDEKPADKKPDAKKADDQKGEKKEDKPSDDKWESEDNPFKKRWKDTVATQNKEHQELLNTRDAILKLQQDNTILKKMVDGTYDPEKDNPQAQFTPQNIAAKAIEVGKALASKTAAVQQFGAEKVEADLNEFHQLFGKNDLVQHLVLNSESPVHEAFRYLERYRFESKYGSTPADWHKNIRAEAEKELTDRLTKEITERIMGRVEKKKNTPSFSSSRGSNGLGKDAKPKGTGPTPLKEIF